MSNAGSVGISVAVGVAVVLQAAFMGVMTRRFGALGSVWITYGLGGLVVTAAVVATRGVDLAQWRTVPWYVFTAGIMGLVIVGGIGLAVPRIGVVSMFTILTATQFALGALVDHFGLLGAQIRPINLTRAGGIAILILGAWLTLR